MGTIRTEEGELRPPGRQRAARPWLWVCAALVAGSWAGPRLGFAGAAASPSEPSLLGDAGPVALLAGLLSLALVLGVRAARRPQRRWPSLAAAGLVLLVVRGATAPVPGAHDAPLVGEDGGAASDEGSGAVVGRLEHSARGGARLVLDDGRPLALRLRSDAPWPASGSRVALLPPFEVRPRAKGPVAPPTAPPPPDLAVAADQLVVLRRARGPGAVERAVADARDALFARAVALPDAERDAPSGLAPALAVGRRDALDRGVADLFTRTGTRHLLALSGLHVGLFALLVAWPLRRGVSALVRRLRGPRAPSPWPRRCGALAAGLLVVAFAALAGSGPPVVRASLVAVLVLIAHDWPRTGPRRCDALGLLALALAVELATEPHAWRDATVALSYGASLALAFGARPTSDRVARVLFGRGLTARIDPVLWLGSRRRIALAVVRLRCERAIAWALGTSIVANLGTLPALWVVFGEFAPIGLVATPCVAPALLVWLPSVWLALLAPTAPTAHAQAWVEAGVLRALELFDALPGTAQLVPARPGEWLALLALASLVVLARHHTPVLRTLARVTCVAWAATLVPWTTAPDRLEVTALDVGHGTCVVARAPGLPLVVFDAGSKTHAGVDRDALRPLLARLDPGPGLLVLSHTDRDHRSAVPWLSTRCRFALAAGAWHADDAAPRARRELLRTPQVLTTRGRHAADASWTLLRGATTPGNEGSYDLLVEWRGRRVLLFGDSTGAGLSALLDADLVPTGVDLALLPHHGGFGAGVERWLAAGAAAELWISAGAPADLVPELERRGLAWRATWRSGPLTRVFEPSETPAAEGVAAGPSFHARPGLLAGPGTPAAPSPEAPSRRDRTAVRSGDANRTDRSGRGADTARTCEPIPRGPAPPNPAPPAMLPLHALASVLLLAPAPADALAPRATGTAPNASHAPEAPEAPGAQEDDATLALRAAKRVLFLAEGGAVRARARRSASGVWEVARDGAWIELPVGAVARWVDESDLLDEYERRRDELGDTRFAVHQRLELARWCEANALFVELIGELDAALTECPGEAMVERFVDRVAERLDFGFELPTREDLRVEDDRARTRAIESGLRSVARLSPAARRIAGARLVERAAWEAVAPVVAGDLRSAGPLGRRLAAELVGRFAPATETKVLLVRAVLDSDDGVRTAAAVALGRADEPALIVPIERALYSSTPEVQRNAAAALAHMNPPAALPVVASAILAPPSSSGGAGPRGHVFIGKQYAYVQDFDVEVAGAAAIADPQIGVLVEGSVLDVRVLASRIERRVVWKTLVRSAGQLAGRDLGDDRDAVEAWARGVLAEAEAAARAADEAPASRADG